MSAGIYVARTFLNPILSNLVDPEKEKQERARTQAKAHLERLNRRQRRHEDLDGDSSDLPAPELVLNEYENLIALEMVAPDDIPVGFDGETILIRPWVATSTDMFQTSVVLNRLSKKSRKLSSIP